MEEVQFEVIGGRTYTMSPVNLFHTTTTDHLAFVLRKQLSDSRDVLVTDASVIPRGTTLKFFPDIAIFCPPVHYNKMGTVKDIPWFIAEVVSPKTRGKDYSSKKEAYEKLGVTNYWIVDPYGKFVIAYVLNTTSRTYDYVGTYQKFYPEELEPEEKDDFPRELNLHHGELNITIHIDDIFNELDDRFVEEDE